MKLLNQASLLLQTWLNDWLDEDALLPESIQRNNVDQLLTEAQAALNLLHSRLAQAVAQHHQANAEWVQALTLSQVLDESIDDDLRAGLMGAARTKETQRMALQERLQLLQETADLGAIAVSRLQATLNALQFRIDQVRKRRIALTTRGQMVALMMELDRLDRELDRDESLVHEGLQAQAAALQKKEDWLAAKQEWKRK